ncbi:MAG TPA: histidine kinase [Patescibacteria group bacterium]|nr:histidine kinase [Patescibacteria group bacterium]
MTEIGQLEKTQFFEWGSILWFVEPGNLDMERLSVGLVTFYPNTTQTDHLHAGDEQVIYVVSGQGQQMIDGQTSVIKPGHIQHISPYTRHSMINNSDEELKLIIVYTPSKFQQLLSQPAAPETPESADDIRSFLDLNVLRGLLNKLSGALGLSLVIVDTAGDFIVTTDNYPDYCRQLNHASQGEHCRLCIRHALRDIGSADKPHLFRCCGDIASIIIPILSNGAVKGYVKCGEIFLNKPDLEKHAAMLQEMAARYPLPPVPQLLQALAAIRTEPKSRLYAAAEATFAIANCIAEMTATALRRKELDQSRLSLIQEQMATAKLEKALQEADLKLLQSQINPHFLFNTLNTIAQMAYIEGAEKAAGLVWNLSDLLRITLRKPEELIPLTEEITMLKNYLHIQQARFGERLQVEIFLEPGLEQARIPCMLLQPLVENAIVHGFEMNVRTGVITLTITRRADQLCCNISDNGLGFDPQADGPKSGGIGLSSIRSRLQYYFNDQFHFQIESQPGQGTTVRLAFPLRGDESDRH